MGRGADAVRDFMRDVAKGLVRLAAEPGRVVVCEECLREGDEVVGEAGDFGLCERCGASVTSTTGHVVIAP